MTILSNPHAHLRTMTINAHLQTRKKHLQSLKREILNFRDSCPHKTLLALNAINVKQWRKKTFWGLCTFSGKKYNMCSEWLIGREIDSILRDCRLEPRRWRHCVASMSKNFIFCLVLVQPSMFCKKTRNDAKTRNDHKCCTTFLASTK